MGRRSQVYLVRLYVGMGLGGGGEGELGKGGAEGRVGPKRSK